MADEKGRKNAGTPEDKGSPFDFPSDELTSSNPENHDKNDLGALTGGSKGSGLGNLPPLSDFDSQEETSSGGPASVGRKSVGGLPPLGDISVDTPVPKSGRVSFGDSGAFDTPISDSGLDTPTKGTGFQDLAADSDFSPETPEIGPGPDSDLETPLFDSAFGGGKSFSAAADTPAPTQAMETPMFGGMSDEKSGAGRDNLGFDPGAFGGSDRSDFNVGTPAPDFSPDTGVPRPGATPPPVGKGKKAKPGGGGGMGTALIAAGIALVVGLAGGIYAPSFLTFLPNPLKADLDAAKSKMATLEQENTRLKNVSQGPGGAKISQAEYEDLLKKQEEATKALDDLKNQQASVQADIDKGEASLKDVNQNIETKNAEYAEASVLLEEVVNKTSIVRARQDGLNAEVQRLESLNGKLEEADARRLATKDTLSHNIELLAIQIQEGIPLAPEKYSREKRMAAVNALKSEVAQAAFVTPAIMEKYTSLYQAELNIAASHEYFFARIPVTDRIGNQSTKWAECVMNGNWSVSYRTLDGKNIGRYVNVAPSGAARYAFQEDLPGNIQKQIEEEVIAARVPDYLEKVSVLAQQEVATQTETSMQRVFSSL